jgi:hypothetical protein
VVETPCPGCRRPVKARDDQVGRRVKCSKCGTRFHVPADARNVLLFDAAPRRRPRRSGLGRQLLAVAVFGLAAGGAAGAVLLYLHLNPPRQQHPTPGPEAAAVGPGSDSPAAEPAANTAGQASPKPKTAGPAADPFPNARPVVFQPPRDNPEPIQTPLGAVALDVPFAAARRVFPPAHGDADPAVLWESRAAFQGVGRRLSLSLFSPQTGQKVGGVEFDADPTPAPACDLSADGTRFACTAGGRLTVWDTKSGAKLLDGLDPFSGRPDQPAAVLLAGPADRVAVVGQSGAVQVWEVGSKAPAGDYAPPVGRAGGVSPPVFGRVAAGRAGGAVVVMAGGVVYRVTLRPGVAGEKVADLGPGVGRPLAVAASAGGKVAAVFEAAGPNPDRFVAALRPDGNHPVYRWPAGVGEPVSAGWCGEGVLSVGTSTGAAVWFEAEGDTFRPLAVARAPGDQAIHAAAEEHWTLLPGPDGKSVLAGYAMPPQGLVDPLGGGAELPAVSLRLDARGLFK